MSKPSAVEILRKLLALYDETVENEYGGTRKHKGFLDDADFARAFLEAEGKGENNTHAQCHQCRGTGWVYGGYSSNDDASTTCAWCNGSGAEPGAG